MKILICSDGTADNVTRLGGLLARAAQAETTLLGIAESADDEPRLRTAVGQQAVELQASGVAAKLVFGAGEPIAQILAETNANKYDLVLIGARRRQEAGDLWRSQRTYEVIKAIEPPVLVAIGRCETLTRFLVCTGGKRYIDDAVRLTGNLAGAVGASITLLHVMAEPPAIYADLVQMEEDVDALLASGSELGRNLAAQKQNLEKLGIATTVRVRHGLVIDQVFAEANSGQYDLIVSGSSRARGPLRHYIMGDLTRSILNRAECPVLVARSTKLHPQGFLGVLRSAFSKA